MEAKFTYVDREGHSKEGVFAIEDYRTAERLGMRPSQYLNAKYSDYHPEIGTAFRQGQQSLGIYTKSDTQRGIQATKVNDILNGDCHTKLAGETLARGGIIVAPSQQGTTPATRVFFPETVMDLMVTALTEDYSQEMQVFNRMISSQETTDTEMFTQPYIDVTAPRSADGRPTSQNALPRTLVSITTSEVSKSILTESVGLQISEQAQRNVALDLVTTILGQQAEGAALRQLWRDMSRVVNGNVDSGDAALTAKAITDYDANAGGGVITQRSWIKCLYDPTRKVSYDSVICTIDDYLAIQDRTGRPLVYDPSTTGPNVGALGTYGLNVEPNVLNWSVGVPNVLIVPDGLWTAQHILMFDSRYALRKVVNASASYSASEKMILQRSDMFRFDWGMLTYRLRDEAFQWLDYS